MFDVRVTSRDGQPVISALRFDVVRYSGLSEGGPEAAEIAISGMDDAEQALDLLGSKVTIFAPDLTPVWWGLVEEVTAWQDGLEYGVSLADMANRICVLYSIATEEGSLPAVTDWADDDRSIARYGRKELRYSLGTATTGEAQTALATLLAQMAWPQLVTRPEMGEKVRATLYCVGFWQTLDWRYWEQPAGRIVHAGQNETDALLGWGFQSSQFVGFDDRTWRIHELEAKFPPAMQAGDRLSVTGSASNNGSFTVADGTQVDAAVTYAASAAFFDPIDDVHDEAERLDQFRSGEMLRIEGSANAGFWFMKGVAADHITVHPQTIVAEGANPVTFSQGNSVQVTTAVTTELPVPGSKFVTVVAHGVKIAQSFVVPTGGAAWPVGEVVVNLRRVGSPADSVKVEVCADSGGAPGTTLDFGVVAGSLVTAKSAAATSFGLNRTAVLTPGNTYWLVVSRTEAVHFANYYQVVLDPDEGYAGGALRLWTGAGWEAKAASLHFQVWGHAESTGQLAELATAFQANGYVTGASVRAASNVYSKRYRDGQNRALTEAQKLLRTGTAAGDRLTAVVGVDGVLIVEVASTTATDHLRWRTGKIVNPLGQPLERGVLPVGRWVQLQAPRLAGVLSSDLVMVLRAEYDVETDTMTPEFGQSVWSVGNIRQG